MHTHEQWPCGWIYVCVFFSIWGILLRFHMLFQQGGEGRHLEKHTCWEAKTGPSNLLGDYGHPLSIFGFASITVTFNNMKPWLSEESGYDVVILDSTQILFYWSIRECYPLILPKNTSSKKNLKKIFPSFAKKKSELYFWVSLVWLLLVVSLVTPKTHITLKKWWLADWQTTFPLKSPFIFCFFFVGSFASFLKVTPTSQAPWQSNSWTKSVPIGRFSAVKTKGGHARMLGV